MNKRKGSKKRIEKKISIRKKSIIRSAQLTKDKSSSRESIQSIQIIGTRDYQEDEFFIKRIPKHIIIAGIFDGHGGGACSKWVSSTFQKIIIKTMQMLHQSKYKILINSMLDNKNDTKKKYIDLIKLLKENFDSSSDLTKIVNENISLYNKLKKINNFLYEDLLKKAINKISQQWDKTSIPKIGEKRRNKYTSGTTALVTLIVGHTVHIMWIGDSRTVWKNDTNKSVYSTKDHKPIKKDLVDGAFIKNNRINGVLAVGRAIGDNGIKTRGALKRTPSYVNYEFKKKTDIVMGSDGVYDKISSNHTVFEDSFIKKIMKQKRGELGFFTDNTTLIKIHLEK
jgi:serine/threonine protein phosphatase PrpC